MGRIREIRAGAACLGGGVLLALLLLGASPASAARLFDYTQRGFTLTGGLGLRYEDYDYNTGGVTSYSRRALEEELKLGSSGFVWDPRLLLFDAGITLRNRDTDYYNGDSDIETLGYRITTTWFRERNPFILYAHKNTNTYSPRVGPSYEFINSNYGFRWRFGTRLLGMLRFGYDRGRTRSDNTNAVRLDEYKDSINIEGKRTFGKVYKTLSVVNYGYRYDNSEDDLAGRYYRQNYWYVRDNTKFSERVNLHAGFTYYDRYDKLIEAVSGNVNKIDSSHANLNLGLNMTTSDRLSHYYNLGASFNGVNGSRVNNYNLAAGLNYQFARYWKSNGALQFVGTSSESTGRSTAYDRTAWGAKGGISYARTFGHLSARAGYDAGFEVPISSSYGEDTIINHSLNAGYSGRWSNLYSDSLSYRLNYQSGSRYESADRERIEHNLNYTVNSRLPGGNTVRTSLNYRDWQESSSGPAGVDNSNSTLRGNISWSRRLWERHRFSMDAGGGNTRSGSRGRIADYSFWYSQARLSMRPWRRLGATALARYEERSGETSNLGPRLTLEANLNYSLAKWQVRVQYRYHDADYEAGAYQDSWLTLYLTRNFGVRF